MQHRDGQALHEPYKELATRPGPEGAITLHRHGYGKDAVEHEHPLGLGVHRHGEPQSQLVFSTHERQRGAGE